MIRHEIQKTTDYGIVQPPNSRWATRVTCVRKGDGTLTLCVDWRKLKALLRPESDDLDDMPRIFDSPKAKSYFAQIDLTSWFHQVPIAEKDMEKLRFFVTNLFSGKNSIVQIPGLTVNSSVHESGKEAASVSTSRHRKLER